MFRSQVSNSWQAERGRSSAHKLLRPLKRLPLASKFPFDWTAAQIIPCYVGFHGDSLDITLCTDEIDDVHIPQFSDDAGSQGEWDPNQATSNRPQAAVPSPFMLSSPITASLRNAIVDSQVKAHVNGNGISSDSHKRKPTPVAKNLAYVSVPVLQA